MLKLRTAFVALSIALAAVACTKGSGKVVGVSPTEAQGLLNNDFAVMVDVREDSEIQESGMAAPAKHIPMSKIEAGDPAWKEFVANTPKDKQIIFYCAKGGRAGRAADLIAKEGFRSSNMGGFQTWVDAGLPVKKP